MAFTRKNEEAVSPVIGVILMVAITVILAAVIAAFVFGMAGNISKTKIVAITVQKVDRTHVAVTNMGGQDAGSLIGANVTVAGTTAQVDTDYTAGYSPYLAPAGSMGLGGAASVKVGCVTHAYGTYTGKTQVSVIGWFSDGTQQVLLDTTV